MKTNIRTFFIISLSERENFRTKFVEKIKTHILFLVTFFENCPVYQLMCKNTVERTG